MKEETQITVTELGITVFLHPAISLPVAVSIIALQLSRLSYLGFSSSTTILARLEHLPNGLSPISLTYFEMVRD